jgi:hypothetical protein
MESIAAAAKISLEGEKGGLAVASLAAELESQPFAEPLFSGSSRPHGRSPVAVVNRLPMRLARVERIEAPTGMVTPPVDGYHPWKPRTVRWASAQSSAWPDWGAFLSREWPTAFPVSVHEVSPGQHVSFLRLADPGAWLDLCERFPRRNGEAIVPDFEAIAGSVDGVWFTRRFVAAFEGGVVEPASSPPYRSGGVGCESVMWWGDACSIDSVPSGILTLEDDEASPFWGHREQVVIDEQLAEWRRSTRSEPPLRPRSRRRSSGR